MTTQPTPSEPIQAREPGEPKNSARVSIDDQPDSLSQPDFIEYDKTVLTRRDRFAMAAMHAILIADKDMDVAMVAGLSVEMADLLSEKLGAKP